MFHLRWAVFIVTGRGAALWTWHAPRLAHELHQAKEHCSPDRVAFAVVARDDNEQLTFNAAASTCRAILATLKRTNPERYWLINRGY